VPDVGKFELTDYLATIRSRIVIATGGGLLYTTAGAAFLAYDDEIGGQLGDTAFGLVVGAGFEHKFGAHFSLGIEGLYYNLSSASACAAKRRTSTAISGPYAPVLATISTETMQRR